jgi:hypothetical protein
MLDVLVFTVLVYVGVSVVDEVVGPAVRFRPEAALLIDVITVDKAAVMMLAAFATVLGASYFVIPWVLLGGSPVQVALRMRVRGDNGRETLTVGRALVRWVLLFPPFATVSALTAGVAGLGWFIWGSAPVWYLVLLVTAARSKTRQALHDRIARSVVCKVGPAGIHGAVDVR